VSVVRTTPSTEISTRVTPTLSDALAETVTVEPETVEPFEGAVMVTVGAVVSRGTVTDTLTVAVDDFAPRLSVATALIE